MSRLERLLHFPALYLCRQESNVLSRNKDQLGAPPHLGHLPIILTPNGTHGNPDYEGEGGTALWHGETENSGV